VVRVLRLLLVVGLASCGGRPTSPAIDALAVDGARLVDRAHRPDRIVDAPPAFCSGPAKAQLAGATLLATTLRSGSTITQCCSGEYVRLQATDASGKPVQVETTLLRFPDVQLPAQLVFGALPKGIGVSVRCDPYDACGDHNPVESTLEGYADLDWTGASPGYTLTLCLAAIPNAPVIPPRAPVKVWIPSVVVHTACTFGMDPTCNDSPLVSATYGRCTEEGTCVCNAGHALNPGSGRCL
jgi:hypothetical protein